MPRGFGKQGSRCRARRRTIKTWLGCVPGSVQPLYILRRMRTGRWLVHDAQRDVVEQRSDSAGTAGIAAFRCVHSAAAIVRCGKFLVAELHTSEAQGRKV